ncbi:MAG: endonuclease III domain-containing protein [Heliobacteriaceae bacterium]|nr:endonuclease III domain-containing protein [Heliobacteriaceae bacterium]MDD4588385.1 endonuclease III domain-containing protein [Heliobacteriaceae bacterium]
MTEKNILVTIYAELSAAYGPQHWWPAETPLEVVVGAILTQNVAWKNVAMAIANLKKAGLLGVDRLAAAPLPELGALIRSTRYYNQKAERLKGFIDQLQTKYAGRLDNLFALELGALRQELLGLRGIGKETADSIILYAAHKPVFVVDAYTRRIFSRLGLLPAGAGYDQTQALFAGNLPVDVLLYQEYHALIVRLGNRVCLARQPLCLHCPLASRCPQLPVYEKNPV